VSAITGACLMSRKEIYEEVGYMNEDLKVAFNDVDFCLKILEKGHRLVYNPNVELVHYESKTRGYEISKEKQERFEKESEKFKNKWKSVLKKPDPYYNINFTRETCNFDIKGE
jgi:GT2 family glycosyltransferase